MDVKCKSCSSKSYSIIDIAVNEEFMVYMYKCRICGCEWNIEKSLVSDCNKYSTITFKKKTCALHRFVYEKFYNMKLEYFDIIHHKNLNKGDSRPKNLFKMTIKEHQGNNDIHNQNLITRVIELENIICLMKEGGLNAKDVDTSGFRVNVKSQSYVQGAKV